MYTVLGLTASNFDVFFPNYIVTLLRIISLELETDIAILNTFLFGLLSKMYSKLTSIYDDL